MKKSYSQKANRKYLNISDSYLNLKNTQICSEYFVIEWKLWTTSAKVQTSTTKNVFFPPIVLLSPEDLTANSASKCDDEIKNMFHTLKQCNF